MKNIDKQCEPEFVKKFNLDYPYDGHNHRAHWQSFKDQAEYQEQVVNRLLADQGNLCVGGTQDIGVEHFHPKSSYKDSVPWVTEWRNLLVVCLGGSSISVHDPDERYGAPDLTCDKKKADTILDEVILNPLFLPNLPAFFKASRVSGEISVNLNACNVANLDPELVRNTINELNLNSGRLMKARQTTLSQITDKLLDLVNKEGKSLPEARQIVAKARLLRTDGKYFRFYSACRSYLGKDAEIVLSESI